MATLDAWLAELRGPIAPGRVLLTEADMAGQVMAQMEPHSAILGRLLAASAQANDPEARLALVVRQAEAVRVWVEQVRHLQPAAGSPSGLTSAFVATRDDMVEIARDWAVGHGLVDVPVLAPLVDRSNPDVLRAWTLYRRAYGRWGSPPKTSAEEAAESRKTEEHMASQLAELQASAATIASLVRTAPACIPKKVAQSTAFNSEFIPDDGVGDRRSLQFFGEVVLNAATNLREAWACSNEPVPPALAAIETQAQAVVWEYMMHCGYGGPEPPTPPAVFPPASDWSPPPVSAWSREDVTNIADLETACWKLNKLITLISYSFGATTGHPNATDLAAMTRAIDQLEPLYAAFESNAAPLLADRTTEARARVLLAGARDQSVFLLVATRENVITFSDGRGSAYETWAQAQFIEHITTVAEDELDRADDWLDPLFAIGLSPRPAIDPATMRDAMSLEWAILADSRKIIPRKHAEFGG